MLKLHCRYQDKVMIFKVLSTETCLKQFHPSNNNHPWNQGCVLYSLLREIVDLKCGSRKVQGGVGTSNYARNQGRLLRLIKLCQSTQEPSKGTPQ